MADEGDQFALFEKFARQPQHVRHAPQFVRHESTRDQQAREVGGLHVGDQAIALRRVTVLAAERAGHLRRQGHLVAGLFKAQLWIPQFQVLIEVIDERQQLVAHGAGVRQVTGLAHVEMFSHRT